MHIDALVRSVVCRRPGTAVLADRHLHPPPPNLLAAFWPANAVMLGCMVRYPRLATPAGWAGGILGFFLAALFTGEPLFKTILLTCGNLAGIGVGYLLMHRLAPADKLLRRPTSLVLLLRNTLAASLAAGVVGAIINPILSLGPRSTGWASGLPASW